MCFKSILWTGMREGRPDDSFPLEFFGGGLLEQRRHLRDVAGVIVGGIWGWLEYSPLSVFRWLYDNCLATLLFFEVRCWEGGGERLRTCSMMAAHGTRGRWSFYIMSRAELSALRYAAGEREGGISSRFSRRTRVCVYLCCVCRCAVDLVDLVYHTSKQCPEKQRKGLQKDQGLQQSQHTLAIIQHALKVRFFFQAFGDNCQYQEHWKTHWESAWLILYLWRRMKKIKINLQNAKLLDFEKAEKDAALVAREEELQQFQVCWMESLLAIVARMAPSK